MIIPKPLAGDPQRTVVERRASPVIASVMPVWATPTAWIEVLSCGHVLEVSAPQDRSTRRRGCRRCGAETEQVV